MLTEKDVRRIVREELTKASTEQNTEMPQVERPAKQWANYPASGGKAVINIYSKTPKPQEEAAQAVAMFLALHAAHTPRSDLTQSNTHPGNGSRGSAQDNRLQQVNVFRRLLAWLKAAR